MPHIELVMEIDSSLLELLLHSLMQLQCTLDDIVLLVFDTLLEVSEVTIQDGGIDD